MEMQAQAFKAQIFDQTSLRRRYPARRASPAASKTTGSAKTIAIETIARSSSPGTVRLEHWTMGASGGNKYGRGNAQRAERAQRRQPLV